MVNSCDTPKALDNRELSTAELSMDAKYFDVAAGISE
jgi:hypothetical protein